MNWKIEFSVAPPPEVTRLHEHDNVILIYLRVEVPSNQSAP